MSDNTTEPEEGQPKHMKKVKYPRITIEDGTILDDLTGDEVALEGDVFRQLGLVVAFLTSRELKKVSINTSDDEVTLNYIAHLLSAAGFKVKISDD